MLLAALALAAGCRPVPPRPPPPPPAAPIGVVHTGNTFDACTAPSTTTMQAWLASSYRGVGIYIGGRNRGCPQPQLSISWVDTALRQGWRLLPLYVGYQAPCAADPSFKKLTPGNAATEAVNEADDAILQANALGIPAGNPIYYDMEGYTGNAACTRAVQDFVSVWSTRLRARGYIPGFYSSANSGIRDVNAMVAITGFDVPDEIWFARWGVAPSYSDPQLNPAYWANHQRHHQYRGGHNETWGGVTINIDSSYSDGAVVFR